MFSCERQLCFSISLWLFYGIYYSTAQDLSCSCNGYGGCINTRSTSSDGNVNKENVALGKPASMSSVWNSSQYNEVSGPACLAVNGNTDTVFRPINHYPLNPNCIVTDGVTRNNSWQVNLTRTYTVTDIIIYPRNMQIQSLAGTHVSVGGQLCFQLFDTGLSAQIHRECNPPLTGDTVTFFKGDASDNFLILCEVQVWACKDNHYGSNCTKCANCINDSVCDGIQGTCPNGCNLGWSPPFCSDCMNGSFGVNCSESCGSCSGDEPCDTVSGNCVSCKPGFIPPMCKSRCNNRTYGQNCTQRCGNCTNNLPCNTETGNCESCKPGFIPPLCNSRCQNRTYGQNCSLNCGQCTNDSICDTEHGECTYCKPGFISPLCTSICTNKTYGQNCSHQCGDCTNDLPCDNVMGTCAMCKPGFILPMCQLRCQNRTYGQNCSLNCGQCTNDSICDTEHGGCTSCEPGFISPLCKFKNLDSGPDVDVAGVVGGVMGAILLVLVIVIVVFTIRRKGLFHNRERSNESPENNKERSDAKSLYPNSKPKIAVKPQQRPALLTENLEEVTADGNVYSNISKSGMDSLNNALPLYRNITILANSNANSSEPSVHSHNTSPSENSKCPDELLTHSEATGGDIYENVARTSTTMSLILHRKCEGNKAKGVVNSGSENVSETNGITLDDDEDVYDNEEIYSGYKSNSAAFKIDSFQRSLLTSLTSGHLTKEFKDLPRGMKRQHNEGMKPENIRKNRFKAMCPYDFNRVILVRNENDSSSDYINASYIKGYQREKAYIASQGPRTHTVDDMWWMIWQEGVSQIVMLTNLVEDGKDKCEEYWPKSGSTKTYGLVTVTGLNDERRADFHIRTFSLRVKGNTLQRNIEQYHYTSWPDHGVPTAASLVNYWRFIKARAVLRVPLLVHCSAGVGRTGTFIALDIAMDMSAHHRDVNIKKIVADLREERSIMVQAETQYKFLYEVILEAHTSRATRLTFEQFEVMFPKTINIDQPNNVIDKEFKMLQQMGTFVPKPKYCMATSEENIGKNRNKDALPDDSNLAYLSVYEPGRNLYVNAVCVPSFRQRIGIILTQLPLPDTLVDIWRLVDGKNISTIVSIGSKEEFKTIHSYCQYWPMTTNDVVTTGPYVIKQNGSSVISDHVTIFQLSLKRETFTREIQLLLYSKWTDEMPEGTADIIHLIEAICTGRSDKDTSPILVQCIDGMAKSGLFCILLETIERAKCDHETDIFLTARHIQAIRPRALTSEAQYRYCYKVAQDYQRQLEVYENT